MKSDKISKYQGDLEDQEQEEVVLVPSKNPRRLIWGDQRSLIHHKSDIERSRTSSFSFSTFLQGQHRLNGTWYR